MTTLRHAYHLADAENWPLIQRDGLLSTNALVARDALRGKKAEPYRSYRSQRMRLPSGAWIRSHAPAELAIDHGVPDIMDFVVRCTTSHAQ